MLSCFLSCLVLSSLVLSLVIGRARDCRFYVDSDYMRYHAREVWSVLGGEHRKGIDSGIAHRCDSARAGEERLWGFVLARGCYVNRHRRVEMVFLYPAVYLSLSRPPGPRLSILAALVVLFEARSEYHTTFSNARQTREQP